MSKEKVQKLLSLKSKILKNFSKEDWLEIGLLTNEIELIQNHSRLLRSLHWGDDDYEDCALVILSNLSKKSSENLELIEEYVRRKYPHNDAVLVDHVNNKELALTPSVFEIPDFDVEEDLVSMMMPFSENFNMVFDTVVKACNSKSMRCLRADSIWEQSVFIQDIFNLIYKSRVVIVDFTDKNPNVMYETGIAHTLGKQVIPITQSFGDLPSDLTHHRVLKYLPNEQGMDELCENLKKRLGTLCPDMDW